MALTVSSNISSLNAQRNLSTSQGELTTALQRLSSGLRINSAKDDAAGLAISTRFTAQIRGNEQAARNANDGISLSQTASGDLDQISSNLQRIRELAVQASNASNSDSDRVSLNNEANQLIQEIDRVAKNSSFNGTKLLDGSFTAKTFQVGANNSVNDRITITSITNIQTANIGGVGSSFAATTTGAATTGALTNGALTLNGQSVLASAIGTAPGQSAASAFSIATAINQISAVSGVTATANSNTVTGVAATAFTAIAAGAFSINGINVGAVAAGTNAAGQGANLAAAVNLLATQTGVTASADATTGALTLTSTDGRDINIGLVATAATPAAAATAKTTFLAQTGLATGNVGVAGAAAVTGVTKAAGAWNAPGAVLNTSIAGGTLVANGTSVGTVALATEAFTAGTAVTLSAAAPTLTLGSALTAGSTYTIAVTGTAKAAGNISFVATGNTTTDALAIATQFDTLSAGTAPGVATATNNTVGVTVGTVGFAVTAVRSAAQVAAGVTVAQATVVGTAAESAANAAAFTGIGTVGTQNSGGVAYNGQQIAAAVQTALTAAGSSSTVSANISTGVITSVGTIAFSMGGTAADTATATANKVTLIAQTGLLAADLGTQAFSAVNSAANHGTITLTSSSSAGLVWGGANAALAGLAATGNVGATTTSSVSSIANVSLLTAAGALSALSAVDGALATVSTTQGDFGAYQNRFESTVVSLQTTTENLTASRSRIRDADFAKETAALSRAQVLQQAGTAMLAQANQSTQGVLSLLR